MADENHLLERAQIHGPAQHAHVLLAFVSIQISHGFVSEQSLVTNPFALPHVVAGDAQVDGFIARIGYGRMASAPDYSRH